MPDQLNLLKKKRSKLQKILNLSVSAISFFIIFRFIGINWYSFIEAVEHFDYLYFALPIPLIIGPIFLNLRWHFFLNYYNINVSLFTLIKISFKSFFLSLTLPSSIGFDLIRLLLLKKETNTKISKKSASIFFDRLIALLILSISAVVSSIFIFLNNGEKTYLTISLLFMLFILFCFICLRTNLLIFIINKTFLKWRKFGKITNELIVFFYLIKDEKLFRLFNFRVILLILLFQLTNILCTVLIFYALNVQLPIFFHFCLIPIIWVISTIPLTISGLGIREGAFVFFYGLVGVSAEKAIMASLLTFFMLIIIPAVFGLALIVIDRKRDFLG